MLCAKLAVSAICSDHRVVVQFSFKNSFCSYFFSGGHFVHCRDQADVICAGAILSY